MVRWRFAWSAWLRKLPDDCSRGATAFSGSRAFASSSAATGVEYLSTLQERDVSGSVLSLCDKIALLKNKEANHAVPLMKEWEEQGNQLDKSTVQSILYKLRQWRRPLHAMEIVDWMYFRRPFPLELKDTIFRMEIAARANLIKRAQKIFKNLVAGEKTVDAYNVMFLLYSQRKMFLHADDLYFKFKQAKLQPNDYTFSMLACLYRRCGMHFKVIRLQDDMKEAGVEPCTCYLNNLLASKFEVEGIAAAEEIFEKLVPPGTEIIHKHMATFSMMAAAYLSAGQHDKAQKLMEEIEKGMDNETFMKLRRTYHVLISMYSTLKNFDAMERLWGKIGDHKVHDYVAMVDSCGRAGDVDQAEKYFKQADRKGFADQPRLYASIFGVYARAGRADRAEVLFRKMKELNVFRDSLCYHYMVLANLKTKNITRALEILELGQIAGQQNGRCKPFVGTLGDVLKALAETGDVKQAEIVFGDWRKARLRLNVAVYNHLLRVYLKAGKQVEGDFLKRLAGNGQRPNTETHKLLDELKSIQGEVVRT